MLTLQITGKLDLEEPHTSITVNLLVDCDCPHCNRAGVVFELVDSNETLRFYSDSPNTVQALNRVQQSDGSNTKERAASVKGTPHSGRSLLKQSIMNRAAASPDSHASEASSVMTPTSAPDLVPAEPSPTSEPELAPQSEAESEDLRAHNELGDVEEGEEQDEAEEEAIEQEVGEEVAAQEDEEEKEEREEVEEEEEEEEEDEEEEVDEEEEPLLPLAVLPPSDAVVVIENEQQDMEELIESVAERGAQEEVGVGGVVEPPPRSVAASDTSLSPSEPPLAGEEELHALGVAAVP